MNSALKWIVQQHEGGAVTVFCSQDIPWYHIGRLPEDTDEQSGRYQVACELVEWLNGGIEPWWLDFIKKLSNDKAVTPHGCHISATTMHVDASNPKSLQTNKGEMERFIMIQALIKKARPERN